MPDEDANSAPGEHLGLRAEEDLQLSHTALHALEQALMEAGAAPEDARQRALRLEKDRAVVDRLRGYGFAGPQYVKFSNQLMEHGWRTIMKWTRTGEIFRQARQMGRPVPADKVTDVWTKDDRAQIATEAVLQGHEIFRNHGLIKGRWRPEGRANLTTYFVGAATRAFRPAYLSWFAEGCDHQPMDASAGRKDMDEKLARIPDQRVTDPYLAAATRDEVERLLPFITDPQIREGLGWRALGYSQAEAAQRVGLSEKALERRVSRVRAKVYSLITQQPELGEGGAR